MYVTSTLWTVCTPVLSALFALPNFCLTTWQQAIIISLAVCEGRNLLPSELACMRSCRQDRNKHCIVPSSQLAVLGGKECCLWNGMNQKLHAWAKEVNWLPMADSVTRLHSLALLIFLAVCSLVTAVPVYQIGYVCMQKCVQCLFSWVGNPQTECIKCGHDVTEISTAPWTSLPFFW